MNSQLAHSTLSFQAVKKSYKTVAAKSHEIFSTDIEELEKIQDGSAGLIYLKPKIKD